MRELEGGYLPIRSLPTRTCEPPYLVPTYKSEGLASAPPTPAFYKTEPRARAANPSAVPSRTRVATADVRWQTEGTKRRRSRKLDEPAGTHHDVTFREVSRSAVPSRTAEPTYLFGALVDDVKCDLPTYPDGATGDNGPPIRQRGKEPDMEPEPLYSDLTTEGIGNEIDEAESISNRASEINCVSCRSADGQDAKLLHVPTVTCMQNCN